jgi:FkbM family methyltransferase
MPPRHTSLEESETKEYVTEAELPVRLRLVRWVGRQTWLPRGQERLLRQLLNPEKCSHFFFEVDFFGQRYRGDLAHYIDWMVFCYGSAAMSEVTLLREIVTAIRLRDSGPVLFLDIGANAGHHTLFMAPHVDQVIAFEPYPPLQTQIQAKLALNRLTNVELMPFGLGEKDVVLDYYPGGGNSGVGTFLPDQDAMRASPVKLQIRNGDSLLEQLGAGPLTVLKVDVEGFEASVFRGLSRRIQHDQPVILTELSDESRKQFGSEEGFRQAFYPDAHFMAVTGRNGCVFQLREFEYATDGEVLITPSTLGWLREALLHGASPSAKL